MPSMSDKITFGLSFSSAKPPKPLYLRHHSRSLSVSPVSGVSPVAHSGEGQMKSCPFTLVLPEAVTRGPACWKDLKMRGGPGSGYTSSVQERMTSPTHLRGTYDRSSGGSGNTRPAFPLAGFTLIELLIVIAIIAILAALLLPGLAGVKSALGGDGKLQEIEDKLGSVKRGPRSRGSLQNRLGALTKKVARRAGLFGKLLSIPSILTDLWDCRNKGKTPCEEGN